MDGLCLLRSTSTHLLIRLSSASRFISTRVVLEAPYRGTIAHGFLTLALLPHFQRQIAELRGISRTIHHGANRLLIPPAVRNGARIHAVQTLFATARVDPDTSCLTSECSIEIDGETKPACVVERVSGEPLEKRRGGWLHCPTTIRRWFLF